jgi:Tannase and feruloyl esterase
MGKLSRVGPALLLALALASAGTSAHARAARSTSVRAPVHSCASLAQLDLSGLAGASTQIDSAAPATAASGWSYCDVIGTIAPQNQFELQLPLRTYTQRYLQVGCGELCGTLSVVVPGAYGCAPVNDGGFAQASDDEGHTSGGGTFGENPELRADFAYISEHQLAIAAKAIIADFYGARPSYSYYDGCSNGGHEALSEAIRYPHDFNGIVAGAPAMIVQEMNVFFQPWLANVDFSGAGEPILTAAQLPVLHDAVMAACAGADGQIDDPFACHFDPGKLRCHGAAAASCLTAAQVAAARRIYAGPRDPQGQRLYPGGEPYGSELAWLGWLVPYPGQGYTQTIAYQLAAAWLKFMAFAHVQGGTQTAILEHAAFTRAEFRAARALAGLYDSDNPDLRAFEAAGGKLILWQGWADEAVSPYGTVDYYTQMTRVMGGLSATERFARLFMLPGVFHCHGGSAPDQLDAIDAILRWVERGGAPASILATETDPTGAVVATRPIFPYPEASSYDGSGPPAAASSYRGVPSRSLPTTHWLGRFPGAPALWCSYRDSRYACRTRRSA